MGKLYEKVLIKRIRQCSEVKTICEEKDLSCASIDLETAYDKDNRDVLWMEVLRQHELKRCEWLRVVKIYISGVSWYGQGE